MSIDIGINREARSISEISLALIFRIWPARDQRNAKPFPIIYRYLAD